MNKKARTFVSEWVNRPNIFSQSTSSQAPPDPCQFNDCVIDDAPNLKNERGRSGFRSRLLKLPPCVSLVCFELAGCIFGEQRLVWAFRQFGVILGLNVRCYAEEFIEIIRDLETRQIRDETKENEQLESRVNGTAPDGGLHTRKHVDYRWGPHIRRQPRSSSPATEAADRLLTALDEQSFRGFLLRVRNCIEGILEAYKLQSASRLVQTARLTIEKLCQIRERYKLGAEGYGLAEQHEYAHRTWNNGMMLLDYETVHTIYTDEVLPWFSTFAENVGKLRN